MKEDLIELLVVVKLMNQSINLIGVHFGQVANHTTLTVTNPTFLLEDLLK